MHATVLPLEAHAGPLFLRAEVAAVYDQTFFPTLHFQDELGDRSVGDSIKGGADATFDRVNAPDQDDVDLTLQVLTEHTSSIKQAVRFLQAAN